jgi:hypothetical protein
LTDAKRLHIFGAAALVRSTDQPEQTPTLEKPANADAALAAPTDADKALDWVFSQLAAQPSSSVDYDRFLAAMNQLDSDDSEPKHTANDAAFDPVMAADNA